MLALITGYQDPCAPPQHRRGGEEAVKRLMQHYGYVFDYAI